MISAVIIDDIKEARQTLRDDLKRYCPQVNVLGEGNDVQTGVQVIEEKKPEVVFLDVQLGNETGFEILEKIKSKDFKVIFTTGSDRFAIQAIKFSALDYLLKPIDPDDLVNAVNKISIESKNDGMSYLNLLIENLKHKRTAPQRIALNSMDRVHIVNVADIIRCESQGSYTLFYLQNNQQILVTRTMKEFEDMFDPDQFVRVHNSHLININFLREYVKTDGGYAVMSDKAQVPVSVRKKEHLMKLLGL